MKSLWVVSCAAAFAAVCAWAGAEAVTATVTGVQSGDLITIQEGGAAKVVRLYGVACPETGQPYADKAKQYVTEKVLNKEVSLEIKATDSEGRPVAMVIGPDYVNLNQSLLDAGLAWWDSQNAAKDAALKGLNAKALAAKSGLWSEAAPLSPWDYRAGHAMKEASYSVGPKPEAAPAAAAAPKKEEPKVIAAKGTEEYKGGGRMVNVKDIQFDKKLTEADGLALLAQHTPTVAKDASGKPIGLAVPDINSIPYANALGFQDGDVISGVNGDAVTDFSQVMPMIEKYKNAQQINVQVVRGGQPTTVTINLR